MSAPRITVRRGADCFTATFHDDEGVRALFGGETLPTPFLPSADPEAVVRAIRSRNPGATVTYRTEER